jgi:UDP-GlcNAc:undecaprenyl-phosphate/decaprenyl-phosphate GlcNAc-1-phosphate transferase
LEPLEAAHMTRLVLTAAFGSAVCLAILLPRPRKLSGPAWLWRRNWRGAMVPLTGGYAYFTTAWVTLVIGWLKGYIDQFLPWAVLIGGFALAGAIDDVWGKERGGGFRRHFGELLGGRPTTGSVKAMLGGLTALVSCWLLLRGSGANQPMLLLAARITLGAVLVALSANLVNLLDLRPGRAAKVCATAFLGLAIWGRSLWTPVMLGAVAVVGWADLRERTLIGDLGANLLGALVGLSLVVLLAWPWQCAALALVAGLTLLSEVRSLTEIIEGNRVLRAIDGIGRLP